MNKSIYIFVALFLFGCDRRVPDSSRNKQTNYESRTPDTKRHVRLSADEIELATERGDSGDLESIKRLMAHYSIDIDQRSQSEFRRWKRRFIEAGGVDSSFEIDENDKVSGE